jgi:hypothetical protein
MSLYDVRDRADRVDKWLKEDDELIASLYASIDGALHSNPEVYSFAEHDLNMLRMKDIIKRYAILVERADRVEGQVNRLGEMCSRIREAVDNGYIEVLGGD